MPKKKVYVSADLKCLRRHMQVVLMVILSLSTISYAEQSFNVGFSVLDLTHAEKTISVAIWYPTKIKPEGYLYGGKIQGAVTLNAAVDASSAPYPLLVFAHGVSGSGIGYVFLTEALAARGWIVVAPDFHDSYSAVRIKEGLVPDFDRSKFQREAIRIAKLGPADREELAYRLDEMQFALDGILSSKFGVLIDRSKIAVGGHSLGGFTALGLSGTIPERHDARIKALLLYSADAGGYLLRADELTQVKIPSIYFLGEKEKNDRRGDTYMQTLADKVFNSLALPKYFAEISGAKHGSFNNWYSDGLVKFLLSGSEDQFDVIRRYSIAFLEKYVAGNEAAGQLLAHKDAFFSRYVALTTPPP